MIGFPFWTSPLFFYCACFIMKIRDVCPTFFEFVGNIFWFSIASKDSFFVSLYTNDALTRLEVCKVPYLLSNKFREFIENFVIGFIKLYLIFFCKHDWFNIMEPRHCICTILSHEHRFARASFCHCCNSLRNFAFADNKSPPSIYQP